MRVRFRQLCGAALCSVVLALGFAPAASASVPSGYTETLVVSGLAAPTAIALAPDGRFLVTEQGGRVRVIKAAVLLPTPFVTVPTTTAGERGLLGVTIDPAFTSNHFVYVYYTATSPTVHNRISRFTANGDVAVTGSEFVLMDLDNLSSATNYNGGALHFGPDGKLYVSVGENANGANAQSFTTVLGKILRLNSNGSIPTDNPYYGSTSGKNCAIWALGVRNPYTFAFQPGTGRMFINDVGESTYEEIDQGVAGSNYGWPATEGPTSDSRFRPPLYSYTHANGECAIVGAAFYNPTTMQFPADFAGDYFFADFCAGWIRRFDTASGTATTFATNLANPVDLLVAPDGSLYELLHGGSLYRVTRTAAPVNQFQNPSFEPTGSAWLSPWFLTVRSPAQATIARDTNASAGTGSARVTITTASTDWYVQLLQHNLSLRAGTTYQLSFSARASTARTIRVAFQRNTSPYTLYFQQNVAIGTSWQRYTVSLTAPTTDADALFNFNVGNTTGQVWLDDVALTP